MRYPERQLDHTAVPDVLVSSPLDPARKGAGSVRVDDAAPPGVSRRTLGDAGRLLATAALVLVAYVAAAEVGFRLAFAAPQVTTVWAPTGIAVASLLLWGPRLWPAVWIAAFLVNAATAAPLWTAFVVATGNTLEAVAAAWTLRALPGFNYSFRRVVDVLAFVLIAAVAATMVSATIGVTTLCAAGVQPWARFSALWSDWWLGDAIGALVIAPAILTTMTCGTWRRREWLTVLSFVGGTVLMSQIVFGPLLGLAAHPLEYVIFPAVVGAALVGGPPVTSLVVLCAAIVSIWNTVHGAGPFAGKELHHNLILLQAYMGVLAGTALLLSAAVAERRTTEHRERDAAAVLRHREEMLRLAQRAGGVATFEWDFRNQLAYCSAEFFRIFGLTEREGVMTPQEWADFVHPDDRDRMGAHLTRVLGGIETGAADYRIIHADGSVRWLSYVGQLRRMPDGDRLLGTVLDITDRKRTETELKDARDAAEAANQLKDDFLATLSHELRTPLNAILGYARMLQTNSIAPDKRQHAIEAIERNASAQAQLVADLLDMSRITTGKLRLDPEPVPIGELLRDALEGIRPAADAKHIAVTVDVDPAAGTVTADRTRLQQVLWNVLTNAVKFSADGGRIAAAVRRDGTDVEISVADEGIGIAPEFLPFVFDPFRQADVRPSRAHGGLGLGLAIARQLVELHGGTIRAFSDGPGAGATFVIRLPRRGDESLIPNP